MGKNSIRRAVLWGLSLSLGAVVLWRASGAIRGVIELRRIRRRARAMRAGKFFSPVSIPGDVVIVSMQHTNLAEVLSHIRQQIARDERLRRISTNEHR